MVLFHTQRLTAAAALTPPKPGMYLVKIRCIGGATWGSFSYNYDGVSNAHFAAPSTGTTQVGHADFEVNHLLGGTNIPAASMAFNGGLSVVELIYSDEPNAIGKPLTAFRAVRAARTDAVAVTADITTNFDATPSAPKGVMVGISASLGRVTFAALGPTQLTVEAVRDTKPAPIQRFSTIASANSVTASHITDGAATIQTLYFY